MNKFVVVEPWLKNKVFYLWLCVSYAKMEPIVEGRQKLQWRQCSFCNQLAEVISKKKI
jgi:hypothetical protein